MIVIPDLHGRLDLLELVLAAYPLENYLFLGDLIDRGGQIPATVARVVDLMRRNRARLVWGNHEVMAMLALERFEDHTYKDLWLQNGGDQTLAQYSTTYQLDPALLGEHLKFITDSGRDYLIEDGVLYAHASRPTADTIAHVNAGEAGQDDNHLWDRIELDKLRPLPEGVTLSVHGHTPQRSGQPLIDLDAGVIILDLGWWTSRIAVFDSRDHSVRVLDKLDTPVQLMPARPTRSSGLILGGS